MTANIDWNPKRRLWGGCICKFKVCRDWSGLFISSTYGEPAGHIFIRGDAKKSQKASFEESDCIRVSILAFLCMAELSYRGLFPRGIARRQSVAHFGCGTQRIVCIELTLVAFR
jgi:hypothetical protein